MTGVSYLACAQYQVAPLSPPHLTALNPWEGFSDWYREFGYHGGIRETRFVPAACGNLNWSTTRTEDTDANMRAHPLWDAYWASKECALEEIEAPIFIVASWSDQGLHLRGTLEAYKRVSSPQKWIEIHGRKKWAHYYTPANVERLRVFFDRFLKGIGDGPLSWPKVQLEVRERAYVGTVRAESEWPLQRTRFRKLFLDASRALLADEAPPSESVVRYDSTAADGQAVFDYRFDRDAELTGHAKLLLWVEAEGADDMDLFVALQKLDGNGHAVGFVFYAMYENGPVALGWLRASHRALDPLRSRPEQPVHPHTREERLERGEIVPVEIEIWPFSTLFRAGERLRVVVKGRDIYAEAPPTQPFALHQETRNAGFHVIHTGGAYDSHLLVPEIPAEDSSGGRGSMSRTLTEADFRDYIAAFNRDDFDGFARYYADDVIFEGRGRHFRSRDEVVAFYRMVKRRMRETITIRDVIADEHAIAAEIETELQALKDWPDFVTGPVVAGQRIRTVNFVWYRLGDGNFTHVRSARYRKIE
jgi:predicted acyl esterase